MAFPSMGDRGALKSPREGDHSSLLTSLTSPLRLGSSHHRSSISSGDATRGHLHRRFTTNNMPTLNTPLSPIGQQRRQAAEPELTSATVHKLQVLERKKKEYEYLKDQRRRFEAEMELIDLQSRHGEEEIRRLSSDIHHSQPTTPPEFNDINGFPTALSRPNRFSMSSINPGMSTPRGSRSGSSHLTSPPSGSFGNGTNKANTNGITNGNGDSNLPSKSVPGSRRNSDEEGDDFDNDFAPQFRNTNRMSMPANLPNRDDSELPGLSSVLGHINTTAFLFGGEEEQNNAATAPSNGYLQMNTAEDRFPILVRREDGNGPQLSALDLALSQSPGPDTQSNGWGHYRHRQAQQSLPTNTLRKGSQVEEYDIGRVNGNADSTPNRAVNNNRSSVEFNFTSPRNNFLASPSNGMPKLQQSFSTPDVPTLKNGNSNVNGSGSRSHAEQHFHNHNVSIGRLPTNTNGMTSRHSRELSAGFKEDAAYRPVQSSGLHASAAPFGPPITSMAGIGLNTTAGAMGMSQYSVAPPNPYYGAYGGMNMLGAMNGLSGAMSGLSMGQQVASPPVYNPNGVYPPMGNNITPGISYYNTHATYTPQGRVQDSQARVIQSRRLQSDANRFMHYDLLTMPRTEIYTLCKDQHGCRFLQKKLEERNEEYMDIIFEETNPHVVELMTDPFGNYLCQKLLEYANDEQRDILVQNAAPSLVQIALNQHGTRALQKMIEFVSTPNQINMITQAFAENVVDLIQDLNGNHVIQKCLNHLKAEDAQFIFDAVGYNCIAVGTHRHGCCVLQRCIDHASGFQKVQLVRQITANAFDLVQDPFGNYVVQYILDLNDPSFTNPMCLGFSDRVAELSKQKFSSNVIEKCIRCADMDTKRVLISELMEHEELEKLMRDSYGNYVIQTALEFAPPDLCLHLIEAMRPILPSIRQTPYGRRIQSKVQEREGRLAQFTGRTVGPGSPPPAQSPEQANAFAGQAPVVYPGTNAYNSAANIASPQPHRRSNPPLPSHLQNSVRDQPPYQQYGPGHQQYGPGHHQSNGNGGNGGGTFF